jgi:hypothetical protein
LTPQKWTFSVKKPVLPEKSVKKPTFNLPAGFFNKTWVFQALPRSHKNLKKFSVFSISAST